jgi:hypothetical protein
MGEHDSNHNQHEENRIKHRGHQESYLEAVRAFLEERKSYISLESKLERRIQQEPGQRQLWEDAREKLRMSLRGSMDLVEKERSALEELEEQTPDLATSEFAAQRKQMDAKFDEMWVGTFGERRT